MHEARTQDPLVAAGDEGRESGPEHDEQLVVSGSTSLALGPRTAKWDASAADKAVRSWAGADEKPNAKYAQAFFVKQGDGSEFGDYRLGFAEPADGTLTANWGGVTAVAGALSGARGGVKGLTDAEVSGVKSRVAGYYAKARKAYDDPGIKTPWDASDEASVAFATEHGLDLFTDDDGRYAGMGGDFDPVELVEAQRAAAAAALVHAEFGLDVDAAVAAVASAMWQEALAPLPACADCDHAYADHVGTDGPCTIDGCDCTSYAAPDADGDAPGDEPDDDAAAEGAQLADAIRASLEARGLTPVALTIQRGDGTTATVAFDDSIAATLPDEHQPGARTPRRAPGPGAPEPAAVAGGEVAWSAILAPEGKLTSDGRAFAPGSIRWRTLPLTLMAMTETSEGGHVGAEVAGRIDRIWRDDTAGLIRAEGVFDDGEYGQRIAGLVEDKTLRGNSVDLAIHRYVSGPRSDWFDEQGEWAPKTDDEREGRPLIDLLYEDATDPIISVVTDAEIGMSTVCPFPAFAEAEIAVGDSLVASSQSDSVWTVNQQGGWTLVRRPAPVEPLTASAAGADDAAPEGDGDAAEPLTASAAGLAPEQPPAEWFTNPEFGEPVGSIVVDDEGRVSGYAALWDTCHLGFPGQCVPPPQSETDYAYFHLGEVVCADGERIPCGQITLGTGHASHEMSRVEAAEHYDHTGTAVADVIVGEDENGIWVAGALRSDVDAEKARQLRGAKLSGDWRGVNGHRELVALLAVNVPGFPVPRPRATVAAGDELLALTAAGIPFIPEHDLTDEEREQFAALAAGADTAEAA